jgi:transcriptional regulator with XRE-family HTH domain
MANLGRNELASLAGVTSTSISYWEHASASPMSLTSMSKIIKGLAKANIHCTISWLATGEGDLPFDTTKFADKPADFTKNKASFSHISSKDQPSLEKEIEFFKYTNSLPVIKEIKKNIMLPILEIGDIVGGVWKSIDSLQKNEELCIVEIEGELDLRIVKKIDNSHLFDVKYISYDSNEKNPFYIKSIKLERLAPIIRVWRK